MAGMGKKTIPIVERMEFLGEAYTNAQHISNVYIHYLKNVCNITVIQQWNKKHFSASDRHKNIHKCWNGQNQHSVAVFLFVWSELILVFL